MTQLVSGVRNNLWRRTQSGLYAPERRKFPINGLVLYLPLWHPELNGSTIVSKDLNAVSCTVAGALWSALTGRWFDGTNDNITGTSPFGAVDFKNQAFTVEMWAKIDSGKAASPLFFNATSAADEFCITLAYSVATDRLDFIFNRADRNATGRYVLRVAGQTALIQDVWCHILVTYDGLGTPSTTATLCYLNGAVQTTSDEIGTWGGEQTTSFYIFKDVEGGAIYGKGYCGEVRLYDRVLTAVEALHNYNATKWRYQ